MDPFTIHCSSCQSRIRVRNPSMIGQIANCPKCGSMIMITAPQPQAAAPQQILVDSRTGSVTDSVAVTKEALPVPGDGLFGEMPPVEQGFDQPFRSEGLPGVAAPEPVALQSLSPTSWMPEPTPPPRADEVLSSVAPPSSSRQLMLVAAIGLCSVVVACGVFFAFLQWYARPSSVATHQTAASQTAAAAAQIDPELASSASAAEAPDVAAEAGAAAAADELFSEQPAGQPTEQPAGQPAGPSGEPNANSTDSVSATHTTDQDAGSASGNATEANVATADALAAGTPKVGTTAAEASTAEAGSTVASGAPLGSQLMPDIDSTFAVPGAEENAQAVKETLPPGLQNFASIFDQSLVPVLSDATVPLAAAPDAGDDPSATDVAAPAASPMTLALPETLEQKQATTVSGLLIQDRPLAEVLSTLSLMSDIPFTADLDALLAAGIDRNQTVNFKSAKPVTVLGVLSTLTQQYSLNFEPYEKKLFIVRGTADAIQARVPASLPIADLVASADESTALAAALNELLPELGDGFQVADGQLQADLEQVNRLLWFQVARVLETWRVARGIENSETAAVIPKSNLLSAWPVDAAKKMAQRKISQTLLPEPLAHGWHRLAGEAGLTCWVDWPSLVSAQASPSQLGMSISHGRSLQELLQHDANKYQVVFAIEDERTLWVTSPDMYRFQPRLYVLPADGKTVDDWRKELEPLAPFNPDGREALKVVASPDGQFVFIRCCRPLLAQPQL